MENETGKKSTVKQMLIKVVRIILIAYVAMCLGLYFFQAKLVFIPTVGEPDYSPDSIGLAFEDLMLKSGNEQIHAWYVPAKENKGTVLFCHGNAGNLGHRMSTIRAWNEVGMNVLLFDYRGFGKSSGSPSEQGCYEDAEAAHLWLKEKGLLEGLFVIHGRSLGGGVASWASEKFKPDGLILESTFTSVPDLGSHYYPFLPIGMISSIKFPTEERLETIRIPLLVIHGVKDEVIPYKMGRKIADQHKADFIELMGKHNSGFDVTSEYIPGLRSFIEKLTLLGEAP